MSLCSSNKYLKTSNSREKYYNTKAINEISNIINKHYFSSEETKEEEFTIKILNEMIKNLDIHTEFIEHSDKNQKHKNHNQTRLYEKISLSKEINKYPILLQNAIEKNNYYILEKDDEIISINKEDLKNKTLQEIEKMLENENEKYIILEILRNKKIIYRKIKPLEIKEDKSVEYFEKNNFLFIKINTFSKDTFSHLKTILNSFKKKEDKKIIIDLTNNAGGLLNSVNDCLSIFLDKGTKIASLYIKNSKIDIRTAKNKIIKSKIYVLVNKNSASASEIFAAAIKELKKGTIIGEKTYGKGSVQDLIRLKNIKKVSLKITIGTYKTSLENEIEKIGVMPNIKYNFKNKNYTQDIIMLIKKIENGKE